MMQSKPTSTNALIKRIKADADTCVRCGLCLPHCPTYRLTQNEAESPRGRIALAKAFAENRIASSNTAQLHFEHCLNCQACEIMCPANVPYHNLFVNTEQLLQQKQPKSLPPLVRYLVRYPRHIPWLRKLLWLYQKSGCQWLLRRSGLLHKTALTPYLRILPEMKSVPRWKTYYPAEPGTSPTQNKKKNVALFLGCIHPLADPQALMDGVRVLNAYGFNVFVPKQQNCCGALDCHQGDLSKAKDFYQKNIKVFDDLPIAAIITMASGCASAMQSYPKLSAFHETPHLKTPLFDIHDFLLQHTPPTFLKAPKKKPTVLIHNPCTLKNALGKKDVVFDLLKSLGFESIATVEVQTCCGAAGLHMLKEPEIAAALAEPLKKEIHLKKPDFLVTANIGCQLHFQALLQKKEQKLPITHPISLIFREKILKN